MFAPPGENNEWIVPIIILVLGIILIICVGIYVLKDVSGQLNECKKGNGTQFIFQDHIYCRFQNNTIINMPDMISEESYVGINY